MRLGWRSPPIACNKSRCWPEPQRLELTHTPIVTAMDRPHHASPSHAHLARHLMSRQISFSMLTKSETPASQSASDISLSPEQRAAVVHEGALAIMAGAGSGKTSVLAHRIAHRINSGCCDPYRMLAVAFSVRAARSLRERLAGLTTADAVERMSVVTLHALGLRLLREHGDSLGYGLDETRRKPVVRNENECRRALEHIARDEVRRLADAGLAVESALLARMTPEDLAARIGAAKASGVTPDVFAEQAATDPAAQVIAGCYRAYQAALLAENAVDYDDLILQPLRLLDPVAHPDSAEYLANRFGEIACDEFQDISQAQYQLLKGLAGGGAALTVIGDPSQTVFAFRGALGAAAFTRFQADFPHARVLHLSHNYRSSAHIVRVGDAVLADIKPPQIATQPDGPLVALLRAGSEHEEADLVADQIERAHAQVCDTTRDAARIRECAVICRTKAQMGLIERALLLRNLPYTVLKRGGFFDQAEIRQILAYLSLAIDVDDHYAFRQIVNVPARGIDADARAILTADDPELRSDCWLYPERREQLPPETQEALKRLVEHELSGLVGLAGRPPAEALAFVLADAGIGFRKHLARQPDASTRLERVALLQRLVLAHTSLRSLLDEVDVMRGEDPLAAVPTRVQLLTAHDAKGLEFDWVFFVGLEEGLLPHYNASQSQGALLDERRLVYVGLTRARHQLVLSYARTRNGRPVLPSRFLRGLPADCLSRSVPEWN